MKFTIDTDSRTVITHKNGKTACFPLYSRQAFEYISRYWMKIGWNQKYPYTFTWLGRPVIQYPEDMIRAQEVICTVRPDVIVETGVAHGGSLIFYASLLQMMGKGRVIGVDIEIKPKNRSAIEAHFLSSRITLIHGSSIDPKIVDAVASSIKKNDRVMVILDSCHTKAHVTSELDAYCGLVTPGSYIVATDGIMYDLYDTPRGNAAWQRDNPTAAAAAWVKQHPEFTLEQPPWAFNESDLKAPITCWPGAWLRRVDRSARRRTTKRIKATKRS